MALDHVIASWRDSQKHWPRPPINLELHRGTIVGLLLASVFAPQSLHAASHEELATAAVDPEFLLEPRVWPALISSGALLSVGLVWYYVDTKTNAQDWDFPFSLETIKKKAITFEYTRFEDNNIYHNALGHLFSGSYFYNAWRANSFSVWQSFFAGLFTSMIWEYLLEYREVASINDLIVTPMGGLSVGEAINQTTREIIRAGDGTTEMLVLAFNPSLMANKWIYGSESITAYPASTSIANRLSLGLGLALPSLNSEADFSFQSRLFRGRPTHSPGPIRTTLTDAPMVEFGLHAIVRKSGIAGFGLNARHTLVGYLDENIARVNQHTAFGHRVLLGLSSAARHRTRTVTDHTDIFSTVNLVGPTLDVSFFSGLWRWDVALGVYPDFGVVRSFAFDAYERRFAVGRTKSSLERDSYYYSYGATGSVEMRVLHPYFDSGVSAHAHIFRSFDGRDRFLEELTDNFSLADSRALANAWLAVPIVPKTLWGGFFGEFRYYQGAIREFDRRESEARLLVQMVMTP